MIDVCFFSGEVSTDFAEAVRLGVEAGANSVEIRGGLWGKRIQEIDDDDVKRMQEVLASHHAHVASIGSPVGKCDIDSEEEYDTHRRYFDRMIELAQVFQTRIIRGFVFWKPNRKTDRGRPDLSLYMDQIVEKIAPMLPLAEEAGVTLSIETEGSTLLGTCGEIRTVFDALGNSPALSVCWDVRNSLNCGEPLREGYNLVKGDVTHFHVKPNANKTMDPIDDHGLTYADLFQIAIADGFQGAASIEHWGTPEEMLKGVRELRAAVDQMSVI